MADMMLVRPRRGLVPYVPHRPGQLHRRASRAGGHPRPSSSGRASRAGTATSRRSARVPVTPHYTRAVQRKELGLVDEEAAGRALGARGGGRGRRARHRRG